MSPQRPETSRVGLLVSTKRGRSADLPQHRAALPFASKPGGLLSLAAGFALVAIAAAACSPTSSKTAPGAPTATEARTAPSPQPSVAPPDPTTTAATKAPSIAPNDEQEIRETIDSYWAEWTAALADSDPARPGLLAVLAGDAESLVTQKLQKNRALNEVSVRRDVGPMPHRTISVTVSGDTATVTECALDDTITMEATTHQTLTSEVEGLVLERSLERRTGRWVIVGNFRSETLAEGVTCDSY